jgi:hypothetical protein
MFRSVLVFTALASILAAPLAAHADAIDDFGLTGAGHTISYSLPATNTFPDYSVFDFLQVSAPSTVDGVSGYVEYGSYSLFSGAFASILLSVPQNVFGFSTLDLDGLVVANFVLVPATDPSQYPPYKVVATFTPGTYSFQGSNSFDPLSIDSYTLTITPETATAMTPEPPSLTLMATGALGLTGFAAIKRHSTGLSS